MALVKCPQCGKDISDRVKICPKCNFDMDEYRKKIEQEKLEAEKQKQLEEQKKKEEELRKKEEEEQRRKEEALKEKCPECGILVDRDVENCSNCGFPIKEEKIKLAKEQAEKKAKMKKRVTIITIISIVLLAIIFFVVQKNKATKYSEAMNLYEDGKLDEAAELFEKAGGYKDSEDMLEIIHISNRMSRIIKESNFWDQEYCSVDNIRDILEQSTEYSELEDIRHELLEDLKSELVKLFDKGYSDYYEEAEDLITCIGGYMYISDVIDEYKSALVCGKIEKLNDEKNYKEIYDELRKIEHKSLDLQILSDDYIPLYEKYGKFLGDYNTKDQDYKLTVRIGYEWSSVLTLDERINFEILSYDYQLDDASKDGESGRCYKNFSVKDNTMSFEFHDDGSDEPYTRVEITVNDGKQELSINGERVELATEEPEIETNYEEQKPEPQIGDNETDVFLSSWGSPNSKNKTTTEYGVREQWVYGDGRYIYFEDGVVTAIQE